MLGVIRWVCYNCAARQICGAPSVLASCGSNAIMVALLLCSSLTTKSRDSPENTALVVSARCKCCTFCHVHGMAWYSLATGGTPILALAKRSRFCLRTLCSVWRACEVRTCDVRALPLRVDGPSFLFKRRKARSLPHQAARSKGFAGRFRSRVGCRMCRRFMDSRSAA